MRPIELSIKGLHSFREKQTIDFSDLCQGGVFGIFGPTGSGKSSLLDAMTLALYGKVERAPNNTHGIINQAEDELFVSFKFELGKKEQAARYLVERTYKRSGENHVKTAVTRLHNLSGTPVVMADKTSDVNKKVEDMLGLSIDDFTRAVVLPQGKFSEFLKLRGSERRQMLQRIFHLEKYGDNLIKKVKTNLQNATHEKERIESEQQGLGEASREAIETAKKQVEYWNKKLADWTSKKANIDKEADEAKQLKSWQEERQEAELYLKQLARQEESIEEYKGYLSRSNQAEVLLPFAEAFLQAQQEKETWLEKEKTAKTELQAALSKEKEITEQYEQFKQDKQAIDKKLSDRKQTIAKAEEIEKEITAEANERSKLKTQLEKISEKANYYTKEKEKMEQNLEKYNQAVKDFQDQQAALNKDLKNKYVIFQAKEEKQSITYLQNQYEQRKKEEKEEYDKKKYIQTQLTNKQQELKTQQEMAEKRFGQLMYWYNKCAEDKNWFEENINTMQQWSGTYAEKEEQRKQQEMAVHLAAQLENGKACPVCGSADHPAPQSITSIHSTESYFDKKQHVDNWIEYLKTFDLEIKQREWNLQQLSDIVTEIMQETVIASNNEAEDIDYAHKSILKDNQWEKIIRDQLQQWNVEQKTIENLHHQIEKEKKQYQLTNQECKELSHEYEMVNTIYVEKSEQRTKMEKEVNEAIQQWKHSYSELDFDTLEEEYRNIQENDENKEKLQARIDQGSTHIQKLQSELEQWIHERHKIMMEQTELDTRTQQITSYIEVKEQQLESKLEGLSLSQLKTEVQTEEMDWATKEEHIFKEVDHIQKQQQEAENAQAIASHSLNEARKRLEDSKTKWHAQLAKLEMIDVEPSALKQDVLTDEQRQRFSEHIQQHEKAINKWQNAKESLDTKIGNHHISEDEWNRLEKYRLELNSYVDEAREKRGAAVETLQDMQKRQERYQVLEEERKKWEQKKEQYNKLDHVFRGRGFVEFLAEEQLIQVSRTASERLHGLTRGRYAIEVDSQGGFIVRDDANGGLKRPVTSLSGGETFLTSLALALSLSSSIQLRGQYPLEFFFLDEGFGTLDQELLDTVMASLEKLQTNNLAVGIISHVPEIQERLAKKVFVTSAQPSGIGSRIHFEND